MIRAMLLAWDIKTNWQALGIHFLFFHLRSSKCDGASSSLAQPSCVRYSKLPISIPIRNVTLRYSASPRGAAISVGTPPQALAFDASGFNNTYIYDGETSCGTESAAICNARLGGLFDEDNSSSWSAYVNYTAPEFGNVDGAVKEYAKSSGTDVFTISDRLRLGELPFAVEHAGALLGARGLNQLGLGSNSSLLRHLATRGTINSQTWSIWQGWSGAEASQQIDGNIVLGGYDVAKFQGANVTQPIQYDQNCDPGLIITITDITMNLKNSSSISISRASDEQALRACVDPKFDAINLPDDICDRFIDVSGSTEVGPSWNGFNIFSRLILTAGAYEGDLSFTIYPNLNIRIPNHQLVVPVYNYSRDGQRYYANATETEVLISQVQGVNNQNLPILGKPFLSSAYLSVDNDRQSFTLWKAQPNMTEDLISLGPPLCSSAPSSAPTASPSSAPTIPSKGKIAGIVLGGLVAMAAVIGTTFLVVRNRRQKQTQNAIATSSLPSAGQDSSRWGEKPEMASDQHPPLEMPASSDPGYSLAPYEVPDRNDSRYAGEPQEMPSEQVSRQTAHEMPATPMSGRPF